MRIIRPFKEKNHQFEIGGSIFYNNKPLSRSAPPRDLAKSIQNYRDLDLSLY